MDTCMIVACGEHVFEVYGRPNTHIADGHTGTRASALRDPGRRPYIAPGVQPYINLGLSLTGWPQRAGIRKGEV